MLTAAVFSVILAAAAALSFPPVDLPSSCAAVLCPVGTVCRVEPNQNGYLQARCVALTAKPGDCPSPDPFGIGFGKCTKANTCWQDSECDGDQKCCRNPCGGFTCQQPRPSCDTVKCEPGQKCEMQDVVCVRPPCDPQPVCVKTGECPKSRFIPHGFFVCRPQCWSDAHCPGDQKCCMVGCGKRCEDPVPETCATVNCPPDHRCFMKTKCDKRGCSRKPICESVKRCPVYPMWINPNCVPRHDCSVNDPGACDAGYLCCSTDCGRRCVRPVE